MLVNPLILIHIAGGGMAILAGTAAMTLRKGSRGHAGAGTVFFVSMIIMAAAAVPIAMAEGLRGIALNALFTIYLVATARATARRRDGKASGFELGALAFALACAAGFVSLGMLAAASPSGKVDQFSAGFYWIWATFACLGAMLDLNFILRGALTLVQRVRRHLWRMSAAFFIASGSFFMGQQKVMPEAIQGAWWLIVLGVAPLALMLFWLVRVGVGRRFRGPARNRAAPEITAWPAAAEA